MGKGTKKIVGICQIRMGSTRLPGKALADLAGYPMLSVLIQRVLPSRLVDAFAIATTDLPGDDPIALVAGEFDLYCYRGSVNDCLDRIYRTAAVFEPDIVVRLTGDNPFVDGRIIDWVLTAFLDAQTCDYMCLGESFPLGLSVEVLSFQALKKAWKEEKKPLFSEHVTPFITRSPERFKVAELSSSEDFSHMRWTVDTLEDLAFARCVFESLGSLDFTWQEAVSAVNTHPEWMELNRKIKQRAIHATADDP